MSELSSVHLVLGDEVLLVREAADAVVSAAFEGGSPGFNLAVYQAGDGASGALDVARTLPMMARRRVVHIKVMEKATVELLDDLMAYCDKPNPSTVLLLEGRKLPEAVGGRNRGLSLQNKIKKVGRVERFRSRDQRPIPFAQAHARTLGCELDPRAARLLVELVGSDLARLRSEVDKAAAYVGGTGRIDGSAVEAVSSLVAEAVVWDLTDAIVSRDADRGLSAVYRMMEAAGTSDRVSYRLLALIGWQVRQLLVLQDSMYRRADTPDSWRRTPRRKREAAEALLRRRPLSAERILGALARANRSFHFSRAGDRRVFEALVLELVAG